MTTRRDPRDRRSYLSASASSLIPPRASPKLISSVALIRAGGASKVEVCSKLQPPAQHWRGVTAVTPIPAPIVVTGPPSSSIHNSSFHRTHTFCDQRTGSMPLSPSPPTPYLSRITPSASYPTKLITPNIFYCVDHVLQKPSTFATRSRVAKVDVGFGALLTVTMATTAPGAVLPLEQD